MNVSVKERMSGFRLAGGVARDQHGFAQLEGPRRGDLLAGGETTQNHDLVLEHGPALHRLNVRPAPPARVGHDQEDVIAAGPFPQGAHRNRDDRCPGSHRDLDPHGGARRGCVARDASPYERAARGGPTSPGAGAGAARGPWGGAGLGAPGGAGAGGAGSSASSAETWRATSPARVSAICRGRGAPWRTVPASSLRRVIELSAR